MMTLLPLQQKPKTETNWAPRSGCLAVSLPLPPCSCALHATRQNILNGRSLWRLLLSPCCSLGVRGAVVPVAAALLVAGKFFGLEPFAVLVVSLLMSKALCSNALSENNADDDLKVPRQPYEEEIRELLFQNDPSRLHLVDAELRRYKGREVELLRMYQALYAQDDPPMPAGNARRGNVKERAREEEQRRVQASLDASLARILGRKTGGR
ncbi:unnamed protein product [Ectocarpus fasciculatus]